MELVNKAGKTLEQFLSEYDSTKYKNPSLTADIALFSIREKDNNPELTLTMVKRGNHPFIGCMALPGGFVDFDEESIDAARREMMEETGVEINKLRRFTVHDGVKRDPRTRIITIGYMALLPSGSYEPEGGDDADDAENVAVSIEKSADKRYIVLKCKNETIKYEFSTYNDGFERRVTADYPSRVAGDHCEIIAEAVLDLLSLDNDVILSMIMPKNRDQAVKLLDNMREFAVI